jgi:hypothetical protein
MSHEQRSICTYVRCFQSLGDASLGDGGSPLEAVSSSSSLLCLLLVLSLRPLPFVCLCVTSPTSITPVRALTTLTTSAGSGGGRAAAVGAAVLSSDALLTCEMTPVMTLGTLTRRSVGGNGGGDVAFICALATIHT